MLWQNHPLSNKVIFIRMIRIWWWLGSGKLSYIFYFFKDTQIPYNNIHGFTVRYIHVSKARHECSPTCYTYYIRTACMEMESLVSIDTVFWLLPGEVLILAWLWLFFQWVPISIYGGISFVSVSAFPSLVKCQEG